MSEFDRKTPKQDVIFEGAGLHSGTPVRVIVHPASDGIRFRFGSEIVQAHPKNVTDTSRCTKLGSISTVEHLMSALAGCEITDADIELNAQELPALDGSSAFYCQEFQKVGTTVVGRAQLTGPFARVFMHEKNSKIAVATGSGHWKFEYNTGDRWPHCQVYEIESVHEGYVHQIAGARTFGMEEELAAVQAAGLAKGLDLKTALVIGHQGYMNAPLFEMEPARHKMLDLIGDLYLVGVPIRFLNVACEQGGHWINVKAAAMLADNVKIEKG
jgi:UDP-3-O-acyl-N-acetylglucosamine deacetylase